MAYTAVGLLMSNLDATLDRSNALQCEIDALHTLPLVGEPKRSHLVRASCAIANEHGLSLRLLISARAPTSAVSLLRLQYESVTRAMWLTWAADEMWLERLSASLSKETEDAAGKLPLQAEMLRQLAGTAPPAAYQMLDGFKSAHMSALNSFVHGGLHPIARIHTEYPVPLLIDIVKSSNALSIMEAMLVAILSGDQQAVEAAKKLQLSFRDCLPDLLTI